MLPLPGVAPYQSIVWPTSRRRRNLSFPGPTRKTERRTNERPHLSDPFNAYRRHYNTPLYSIIILHAYIGSHAQGESTLKAYSNPSCQFPILSPREFSMSQYEHYERYDGE